MLSRSPSGHGDGSNAQACVTRLWPGCPFKSAHCPGARATTPTCRRERIQLCRYLEWTRCRTITGIWREVFFRYS